MDTPEESIEVIDFKPELKDHFRRLNYEWIKKYFRIEELDIALLEHPQENIIDEGGFVFYAKKGEEIVGTAALLKIEEGVFELAKMGVSEKLRNHGIGNILLEHCIVFSQAHHFKKLILYTNKILRPAIHLYEKYGFTEAPFEPGHYARGDLKMELVL